MGVARAGTLKFARAGPTGINMPAADLSERARSHAHNQPAVMTVKLIFSSIALTELTSFPDLGWPELPVLEVGLPLPAQVSSVSQNRKKASAHLSG